MPLFFSYIHHLYNKAKYLFGSGINKSLAIQNQGFKYDLIQVLIRNELAENRKNYLEILRKQTEEIKEKEREIFLASHRFNLVNKENERLVNFFVEKVYAIHGS